MGLKCSTTSPAITLQKNYKLQLQTSNFAWILWLNWKVNPTSSASRGHTLVTLHTYARFTWPDSVQNDSEFDTVTTPARIDSLRLCLSHWQWINDNDLQRRLCRVTLGLIRLNILSVQAVDSAMTMIVLTCDSRCERKLRNKTRARQVSNDGSRVKRIQLP